MLTNIFQTNQILTLPFLLPFKNLSTKFHSHTINIGIFQEFAQINFLKNVFMMIIVIL